MFCLEYAGPEAFDVKTRRGAFCGIIVKKATCWRVYFNMTGTKGSARKFPSAEAAIAFIVARRLKKGWAV